MSPPPDGPPRRRPQHPISNEHTKGPQDPKLRVFVHDFCGHAFPVELSKELARRGHVVRHVYSDQFQTGKGDLKVPLDITDYMEIVPVDSGRFTKYKVLGRVASELRYGFAVAKLVREFRPEVALTGQDPLVAKQILGFQLKQLGVRWIVWEQDLIYRVVEQLEFPTRFLRGLALRTVQFLEKRALSQADSVICISEDFVAELQTIGVDPQKLTVIENWAPLNEFQPTERPTDWQREQGLDGHRILLYSGTLGLKHDPELLAYLAERVADEHRDVRVVVVSEGLGADYLREQIQQRAITNLAVLPFQPHHRMSEVLGSATGLIVLLEEHAGSMSVPSKILAYLASGRAVLAAIPEGNAAHRQLEASGAAFLAPTDSPKEFVDMAQKLLASENLHQKEAQARRYAEAKFQIKPIADRFLAVFNSHQNPTTRSIP